MLRRRYVFLHQSFQSIYCRIKLRISYHWQIKPHVIVKVIKEHEPCHVYVKKFPTPLVSIINLPANFFGRIFTIEASRFFPKSCKFALCRGLIMPSTRYIEWHTFRLVGYRTFAQHLYCYIFLYLSFNDR